MALAGCRLFFADLHPRPNQVRLASPYVVSTHRFVWQGCMSLVVAAVASTLGESPLSSQRFRHLDSGGSGSRPDLPRASIDSESSDLGENEVQVLPKTSVPDPQAHMCATCLCPGPGTTAYKFRLWQIPRTLSHAIHHVSVTPKHRIRRCNPK